MTTQAQQIANETITMRQLVHRHLNAFEACLEGRLQLVVLLCIGLA